MIREENGGVVQNCHTCHCASGAYFTVYLGLRGLLYERRREIFHDPAVVSRRLWNLQNQIAHQFNYLPSVCYIRPRAERLEKGIGHLISCQKWPQLQVNRSPFPLFNVMALTGASWIFDSSLFTLEMSEEAVSLP